jgi:hypothetical protein
MVSSNLKPSIKIKKNKINEYDFNGRNENRSLSGK